MKGQDQRGRITAITCAGIAGGVIIIVAAIAAIWFFTPIGKPIPTVQIVQPVDSQSIESGDAIQLWVSGESRNGFEAFYLSVDDQLVEVQQLIDPQERNPVVRFTWSSSQPGIHKISVLGVNNSERASQPAEILVVVNQRSLFYMLPVDPDQDSQEVAEGPQDAVSEESDPDSPDNGSGDSSGAESSLGEGDQGEDGENGVDQALFDQLLVDVDMDGDFPLDLPNQPEDEVPVITLFNVQESSDGAGFNVAYQIRASDDIGLSMLLMEVRSLDLPDQVDQEVFSCFGETACRQDGNLQLAQGNWLLSTQALDTSGQSSETHIAQIHTLVGNDPPAIGLGEGIRSLDLVAQSEQDQINELIDQVYDIGQPGLSSYGCSGQIVNLEVPYVYYGDHGDDVYLGATAEKDSVMVAAGHTRIQRGFGIAHIEMEAIAPDLIDQTDELELYFRTGGDYFYEETVELQITWPIPEPDLLITYVSQVESLLQAQIKNIGCSSVQGFDLRFHLPDGQIVDTYIDHYLAPGITYSLENFQVNPNLFSMGFDVIVDPNDQIIEINEANNTYSLAPISLKHVHITRVDIITVQENLGRGSTGEYQFFARVNHSEYVQRPKGEDEHYSLGKGIFEFITTVIDLWRNSVYSELYIIEYPVNWDENLVFSIDSIERDAGYRHDHAYVDLELSSDFNDEMCWKRGGEFSATATEGGIDYFTVYFDVVLNER